MKNMNNPFGLPDEVMSAVIAAALNNQKKGYTPENPFGKEPEKKPPDVGEKAKKSADTAKKFFDAYVAAGFTEAQAFELTKKSNLNTKF